MEESKRRKCCRDFPSLNNIISTSRNGSPVSSPAIYLFILMPDTIPWAVWTLAPLLLSLSPHFNLTIIIIIVLCITPGPDFRKSAVAVHHCWVGAASMLPAGCRVFRLWKLLSIRASSMEIYCCMFREMFQFVFGHREAQQQHGPDVVELGERQCATNWKSLHFIPAGWPPPVATECQNIICILLCK